MKTFRNRRDPKPYYVCHPNKLRSNGEPGGGVGLWGREEITAALDELDRRRGELAAQWATPGELTDT